MSAIEVRPTVPADLDDLGEVLIKVYASDGYHVEGVAEPTKWLEAPAPIGQWTALFRGWPVGHVLLTWPRADDAAPAPIADRIPIARVAVLGRLFMALDVKGQSIARQLLSVAEEKALTMKLVPVLDVRRKDAAAQQLYDSRGWTRIGTLTHRYGQGEGVLMLFCQQNAEPMGDGFGHAVLNDKSRHNSILLDGGRSAERIRPRLRV